MFYKIKKKNIFIDEKGQGDTVLLLPDWQQTSQSLREIQNLLSHHYRAVVVDLPGFGKSDPPSPSWGLSEYAEVISLLTEALGSPSATVVGHGLGGTISAYLTANKPKLVRELVLIAPVWQAGTSAARQEKERPLWQTIVAALTGRRKAAIHLVPGYDQYLWKENYNAISGKDLLRYAALIRKPTCLVWGEHNEVSPLDNGYALQKVIRRSKLVVFPEYKHDLPIVAPKLVAHEIASFISSQREE